MLLMVAEVATGSGLGKRLGSSAGRRPPILPGVSQVGHEPPEEQRDVGAEAASVGVHLVEHHEAAAVVGEERVPVRRPHQQVLQHHVVGEQDVGRVLRSRSRSSCRVDRS